MKYFIRRKSKVGNIRKTIWSALILGSAFAAFMPVDLNAEDEVVKKEQNENQKKDLSIKNIFLDLQISALESLPKATRLDMIDYWDADSVYKAPNVMEGLSWIENMNETYMKIVISPVSTLEIKTLPAKKGSIIMTIYTVGDDVQAKDSSVKFYDEKMNELPTEKYFQTLEVKDFFSIPKGSITKMKEIEQMIPFPTIAYDVSPEEDIVTAYLTVEQYINEDDWNIAKLFAKPYVKLEWKKDKFRIMK